MTFYEIAKFIKLSNDCLHQRKNLSDLNDYDSDAILIEIHENFTKYVGRPELEEKLTDNYELYTLHLKEILNSFPENAINFRIILRMTLNHIISQLHSPTFLPPYLSEPKEKNEKTYEDKLKLDKNTFEKIFRNDLGYTLFIKMHEFYKNDGKDNSNYSFLFYALEKEYLVCNGTTFIDFVITQFDIKDYTRNDSRYKDDFTRNKLFKAIKERYKALTQY